MYLPLTPLNQASNASSGVPRPLSPQSLKYLYQALANLALSSEIISFVLKTVSYCQTGMFAIGTLHGLISLPSIVGRQRSPPPFSLIEGNAFLFSAMQINVFI